MLFNRFSGLIKLFSILIFTMLFLSACSFSPLYEEKSLITNSISLNYAKPNTRLEQIVYNELKLRLGNNNENEENIFSITISPSTRSVGRSSNQSPANIRELILTGNYSVTNADNEKIISGSRSVRVSYAQSGQIIADKQAYNEASERAALELAQIIRLALLAELSVLQN